jgi:transglutaminase/protease-like cytokinesis protein 3
MRNLAIVVLSAMINVVSAQHHEKSPYIKPDSIAAAYFNHSLKHPDQLAQLLVKGLDSEEQKFRAVFRWVADNIEYDLQTYLDTERMIRKYGKNSRKFRSWQARKNKYSYTRTVNKKKAICSGYAMLLTEMCNAVAIPCKVINGYTKPLKGNIGVIELNHAWNAVELSGKWYLCDVTWACCAVDLNRMKVIREFDPNFFLTDPALSPGSFVVITLSKAKP